MTHLLELTVNGQPHQLQVEPRMLLSDVLREALRLTGTHVGCDTSQCGCCTVLLDGHAVKSCSMLALQAQGRQVSTIEGLAHASGPLHPVQQPHWLVSQPTCVPVRRSASRSTSDRRLRGSTCS